MTRLKLFIDLLLPVLLMALGLPGLAGDSFPVAEDVKPVAKLEAATTVDQRLVQADTRFGLTLFAQVRAEGPDKNIFLSPTSASLALSMVYNGAKGETQQAMARALSVDALSLAELNQANGALQTILANPDPKVQLAIANSVWYKQGMQVSGAFAQAARDSYRAEVKATDFGKPGAEVPINQWVAQATNQKIKSIVDRTDALDRMYLINAIYFNGTWQNEFNADATQPEPFTREDGSVKQHPMMYQSGRYRYLKGENFQAVALPYGSGRVNLYVFVPDKGVSLAQFYEGLTPENWESWMGRFNLKSGGVTIPKLKLEYSAQLKAPLSAMGMGVAFSGKADFTGLFDGDRENLAITSVLQKTYLDMNEKGTEAAAVTHVAVGATAIRVDDRFTLVADRPYFIAIRDDRTGAILFLGSIVDPQ
ncbi:MAG TPA: serpin family protein [Symbiobacteriaceae bacterium]|nr:serpin family protein [Symbiobacteriaceae bacterium]